MTWLRANVGVLALGLTLFASGLASYVRVHDLEAQVANQQVQIAEQEKQITILKAVPAAVDSLRFADKLKTLWFTCREIEEQSAEFCRRVYVRARETGQFPEWSVIGPPDSTEARP